MKGKLILFLGVLAFTACKKEKTTGPQGPQGPQGPAGANGTAANGSIYGKVRQYDEHGGEYNMGLNTTTINIEGTDISTITDVSGNYTLTNIPTGIYDLALNRPLSGTKKYQQISYSGNGNLVLNMDLSDKATWSYSNGSCKDSIIDGEKEFTISLKYPVATNNRLGVILFSKNQNVIPSNKATFEYSSEVYINSNTSSYFTYLSYANLKKIYESGTLVYVTIFPNTSRHGNYYDFYYDSNVYPSVGTPFSQTFTLTIP